MTVRILCRAAGRNDIVLNLLPGHFEHVHFDTPGAGFVLPPNVAILLLTDDRGADVTPKGLHIDPQRAATTVQQDLLGGAA